ncbi:XdhC family protein [Pseudonocardia sp. S2-4]|uniref:XdhC family protein n=2 Tax=Pseudonocardia humida TaxID=2800819 RepID=A0ABT0ZVN1_9PSEU|nr:XdhC family protein [Pseudonocardia humida]
MADGRLLDRASRLRTGRTPFVLATVVRAERPTSARPGDQALVLADGTIEGFVGGSCAESTTRAESLRVLTSGEAGLLRITPGGAGSTPAAPGVRVVDNPCLSGGALEIFLEPVLPPALVLVCGRSPVARALVRLGGALDHDVRVVDDPAAPLPADTAAVGGGARRPPPGGVGSPPPAAGGADPAAVVVASHGHDEEEVLAAALAAGVPYIALVASPARAAGVLGAVAARGAADVERVHAPAGLDIGARTPNEIAVSIYAQIVAARSTDPLPQVREGHLHEPRVQEGHLQVHTGQEGHLPDPPVQQGGLPEPGGPLPGAMPRPRQAPAVDPVCGMEVVAAEPTPSVAVGDRSVWFCGSGCRDAYLADPDRYPR